MLTAGGAGAGCVVREQRVARPGYPHGCAGGVFVEGHYGPRGRWHPGHWRCPGVIERIEIE
jgi:hypothetical protein